MKDWKAEYDKLKGVNEELQRQNQYMREVIAKYHDKGIDVRDKFKELLIDVLGR